MAYGISYLAFCHIFIWHTYGTWRHYLAYGMPYPKNRRIYDFLKGFVCHMPYIYGIFEIGNVGTSRMETYPKDLGVAFALEDVKWASKQLWAPDCVEKDGKYYYVFPARDKNKMFRLGIAIADNPAGPFTPEPDYIKGSYSIDPCMFPDSDGKYYVCFGGLWGGQLDQYRDNIWSANNREPVGSQPALSAKIALMKDDLLEFAEDPRDLVVVDGNGNPITAGDEDKRFFEAPWIFKKDDTYYFTYSTGTIHNVCYATSKDIYGPYTYRGVILTPVLGWTTHHSILEIQNTMNSIQNWLNPKISRGVKYKFGWINSSTQKGIVSGLGLNEGDGPKLVLINRGSRKRFHLYDGEITEDNLQKIFDRLASGDLRFKAFKGNKIPELDE